MSRGSLSLERLNPLTTLTGAAAVAVITTAAAQWAFSLTVLCGLLFLTLQQVRAAAALRAAAAILLPFWAALLLLHGLFFPEGRTVLMALGPAAVTREGLLFALDAGLRTGVFVLAFLLFSFTVRVPELLTALSARGFPPRLVFVIVSALTLLPAAAQRIARIRAAQEARGLVIGRSLASRLLAARLQAVPLVLSLVHESGERAQALDARGFSGRQRHSSLGAVPDSAPQWAARRVLLVLCLAAVAVRVALALFGGRA
ncbi:energy-coupling factor transporter transmembrane component T [Arthrobacter cupressi]|uniref:Energy-coupling factor transport system permease protein n=1 Tax=Arthrobacter cupressi TaxID=1045773 RepID=A0A1G8M5R2_9MICC|nr:energy-coupling factor transporter transmembrane component T [Arthrobacter cupressi]NYD79583.1 energy-coupling factor transport system permease protein [Arthrobacter cupressi]SDI63147.1 energy-coupling factor transport system permease protein [Arthrobacter cupressi]